MAADLTGRCSHLRAAPCGRTTVDVALQSGNGCCRVDRIACAGVENRGKKRKSTKRCGLDRLNLIYAKRAVVGPINGLIRYPRLPKTHKKGLHPVLITIEKMPFEVDKNPDRQALNMSSRHFEDMRRSPGDVGQALPAYSCHGATCVLSYQGNDSGPSHQHQ